MSYLSNPVYLTSSDLVNDHDYSSQELVTIDRLQLKIADLSSQIASLNAEQVVLNNSLFSIEKLQNYDSAIRFYTGFPTGVDQSLLMHLGNKPARPSTQNGSYRILKSLSLS